MEHKHLDQPETIVAPPAAVSRRRLLKGGLIGATVVAATVVSRPALAHTCKTPSAYGSLNTSRPVPLVECGYSPGYWKSKPGVDWPVASTTPFNVLFPGGQQASPGTLTLMEAISMGGGDLIALRRLVIAAVLNARIGAAPEFLTETEVKGMWNAASTGITYINSTRGIQWTPDQVKAYFGTLFA